MHLQYFALYKALLESELERTESISFTDDFLRELFYFCALLLPPHSSLLCSEPQEAGLCGQCQPGSLAHWSLLGSGQSEAPAGEGGAGKGGGLPSDCPPCFSALTWEVAEFLHTYGFNWVVLPLKSR